MVTSLSSTITSLVRKSAPMVALYLRGAAGGAHGISAADAVLGPQEPREEQRQPAAQLTAEHWRTSVDLMLAAPFFLARACAPGMAKAGYGRIVNTASLQSAQSFPNSIPYAASKSGVLGLTRAIAEAYSPAYGFEGITCNAIAPGFVETELTASVFANDSLSGALARRTIAGRNSVPADLVGAAIFLCSPASAYITAQTLYVDGGFTALGQRPPAR